MEKIKVNHELPISLLHLSKEINDYEFVLPHLLDHSEKYRDHMMEAKSNGVYMIMDNSLHELGEAYNHSRLEYWINTLQPDEFIVPDVWENPIDSYKNASDWIKFKFPSNTTAVAVVQVSPSSQLDEFVTLYKAYKRLGYEKIAFSYGLSSYNNISMHPNKDMGKALGRIQVILKLIYNNIIEKGDRIHLLGCSLPQEFSWYYGIGCIESIDTSNPIMAALSDLEYGLNGLTFKPLLNLNVTQDWPQEKTLLYLDKIKKNVSKFRSINYL